MTYLVFILTSVSMALLFWLIMQGINQAVARYEQAFKAQMQVQLSDAFIFFDPMQLWTVALALAVCCALGSWLILQNPIVSALMFTITLVLPKLLIALLRKRRLAAFDKQLPDFLLGLSGALQAGSGVQVALTQLSQEVKAPLSQELSLVLREQRMGVPFDDCLCHLADRMPSESCQLFVSALRIGAQTGGNLAEALERIAATLSSRIQIQGRINALTSQGKMQAVVMCLLPILLMVVLSKMDPDAMHHLWYSPIGWGVLGLIAVLELLGLWLINKIVSIDI